VAGPDKKKWEEAMRNEMESLHHNKVWKLMELPDGHKAIGGKWIFKRKVDEHGNVNCYKARYVAQGFSQIYGEDYDEVFAPVAKQTTLRTLLAVVGKRRMQVKHFDAKTAFLNGELKEELFIKQPEGFVVKGKEHLVCKLEKSIYGLKQSARTWNKTLHDKLKDGFTQSGADQCIYTKQMGNHWVYLLTYVDDIIMARTSEQLIDNVAKQLGKAFGLSFPDGLKFYLGIQVEHEPDGTFSIHQELYIERIIERFGMKDSKPSKIPLDPGYMKRNEVHAALKDYVKYRSAIGALLYVSTYTRPDIAVATSILSQKTSEPTKADWEEVKRIIRCLKFTLKFQLKLGTSKLLMNHDDNILIGNADADWAGDDVTDRKSNSGYLFKLFGGSISSAGRN
jgi:hypothetical protein